jgi:phosphoribosylformylglycinamidine cyclo-ligase
MDGIVRGCEEAECLLAGGETAEMPDMYAPGDIDLAGFAVGIGEKKTLLPAEKISAGHPIYGLPSSGIHSNGLSLARKIIAPESGDDFTELLTPTRIYVKDMKSLLATGGILAAAHVTGGGLEGNLGRVLPEGLRPELSWDWPEPDIFEKIRRKGSVVEEEMRRVFNLGIGMALVVEGGKEEFVETAARNAGIDMIRIGVIENG